MTVTEPGSWGSDKIVSTDALSIMGEEVYACNVTNKWFEEGRTFGDDIALLHSEVSEMLEEFRDGNNRTTYRHENVSVDEQRMLLFTQFLAYRNGEVVGGGRSSEEAKLEAHRQGCKDFQILIGKPIGVPSEAADVLIRLLDTCKRYDIDLFTEFRKKLDYNWTRGPRHGSKAL